MTILLHNLLNLRDDHMTILMNNLQGPFISHSSDSQPFLVPVSLRVGQGLWGFITVEPAGFVKIAMSSSPLCPDAQPWPRQLAGTQ